jgi:four helix bundle protein
MRDFKELQVWQRSHSLAVKSYQVTKKYPREEIYGLTSQIRRACLSVPANIAEGCGKNGTSDFARFLQIAMGSASELEYLFLFSHDIGILQAPDYKELTESVQEIKRMLASLIQKIKADG